MGVSGSTWTLLCVDGGVDSQLTLTRGFIVSSLFDLDTCGMSTRTSEVVDRLLLYHVWYDYLLQTHVLPKTIRVSWIKVCDKIGC